MDLFQTTQDKNGDEIKHMGMILSNLGILYYVNMRTGIIGWGHDLKIQPYQTFQQRGVDKYIDVGDDRESPYLYSSGSRKVIIMNEKNELLVSKEGSKEPRITKDIDKFFLTRDGVDRCEEGDENIFFKITRTEWSFIGSDWSLRYSNIDVLDKNKRVYSVHYARTAEQFTELCHLFGLHDLRDDGILTRAINETKRIHLLYPRKIAAEKKVVGNGDVIRYFYGRLNKKDVFVKVSQSKEELSRVRKVYEKSSKILSVVELLLFESVGDFNYFAFEGFQCNLATFIQQGLVGLSRELRIGLLRDIIKALLELHANHVFHQNFAPESVLIKRYAITGRYLVKLCGMGASKWCKGSEFKEATCHHTEMRRLARTILMFMTNGIHKFSERECFHSYVKFQGFDNDLLLAGVLAADLIKKLRDSRISLQMVLSHVLFWDPPRCLSFLKDISDDIIQGKYKDIDVYSGIAFEGGDWTIKSEEFQVWFDEMEKVLDSHMKVSADQSKADQSNTDHDDMAKKKGYDTTSLKHLLWFIRNTVNQPTKNYPGDDKVNLHGYIMRNYPYLLLVVYNHMIDESLVDSSLYKDYGPKQVLF